MATAETLSPSPFTDPTFFDDPYPFIHRLRREDPVGHRKNKLRSGVTFVWAFHQEPCGDPAAGRFQAA